MLDSIGAFKLKKHKYENVNFYQFFKSRYGMGNAISKSFCYFSGIHPFLKVSKMLSSQYESSFSNSYIIKRIKFFFLDHVFLFDHLLLSNVNTRIALLSAIRSYRGRMHDNNLPVRGQRRRTNARTQKRKKSSDVIDTDLGMTLNPSKLKKTMLKSKKKVMPTPKNTKGKNKKK